MSEGLINSPAGAHEHHIDVVSGLVDRDKSTYTTNEMLKYRKRSTQLQRKKYNIKEITVNQQTIKVNDERYLGLRNNVEKYQNHSNYLTTQRQVATSNLQSSNRFKLQASKKTIHNQYLTNDIHRVEKTDNQNIESNDFAFLEQENTSDNIFLSTSEIFQKSNETTMYNTEKSANKSYLQSRNTVLNEIKNNNDKNKKSRYFKQESINTAEQKKSVNISSVESKLNAKGVTAVDMVVNPIMDKAREDDMGGEMIAEVYDITSKTYLATEKKKKADKKKQPKNATSKTSKKGTTRTTAATEQATKKGGKEAIKHAPPPVLLYIIAGILITCILYMSFSMISLSVTQVSSYSGTGDTETQSLNDYSEIYDYVTLSIAQRYLSILNLQHSWSGYLKYDYEYQIEDENGNITSTTTYPIADVAPIMAYLGVHHKAYKLTNSIKTEIDNIVSWLYTFNYRVEDFSYTVDHYNYTETYSGEKITFIIKYNNSASFFEDNNYLAEEEKTTYAAIKQYGDMAYFKLQNMLLSENWHDFILEPYGYSVTAKYDDSTHKYTFSLADRKYTKIAYRTSGNVTAPYLFSPLDGVVESIITTSDYDYIITLKDSKNDIVFKIMVDFKERINLYISQGQNIKAGQKIASRDYPIYISCTVGGQDINPLLIMEHYKHSSYN